MFKYAGVIVNNDSIQLDRIFTYEIPERLQEGAQLGIRVKVPFGLGNRTIEGYIIELYDDCKDLKNVKAIAGFYEDFSWLTEQDIALVKIMREKYLCTYLEGIRAIIPTGLSKGLRKKTNDVLVYSKPLEGKYVKEPYITIIKYVAENNGIYNKSELSKKFAISASSINTLLKYGFLSMNTVVINRFNDRIYEEYKSKNLNDEQENAVGKILDCNNNLFLLHGITGSGKTEIYMSLVSEMLKQGKDSIVLVPEISLTPQMIERFKGRFGKEICVFHSKLSEGERYDEWLRVKEGTVKVAVGARSAIFLPFNDLGLIIVDEEHESSYKSDSDPKYNAKEIGEIKCSMQQCKMVLGTATPSLETYYRTTLKEIEYLSLKNRADGAIMPSVEIVDMREELEQNNRSIFSRSLYENIKHCLSAGEQIILFLNRRGFSTFVSCRKCGYVFKCSNCDISLTYHWEDSTLNCHYCGKKQSAINTCPQCGSKYVKYFGAGTEKVEQEIKKFFPTAKVLRMDLDTTRFKHAHENIYNSFKEKKADILIGTQMIAKGLDFKEVTLVGVIAADLSLNLPDYRATERTFQLITQVSGRAGRGKKRGKVIIQTYNPENYSIRYSAEGNFQDFFKEELNIRKDMLYPPFSKILCINLTSRDEDLLIKNIQYLTQILRNKFSYNDKIEILGPCPCAITKIKEQYRWQIIFKGIINNEAANAIKQITYETLKENYNNIRIGIDINPNNLL